jgi:hypothetical protein
MDAASTDRHPWRRLHMRLHDIPRSGELHRNGRGSVSGRRSSLLVIAGVGLLPPVNGVLEVGEVLPGRLRRINAIARRVDRGFDELHLGDIAREVWKNRAHLYPHNQLCADGAADQWIVARDARRAMDAKPLREELRSILRSGSDVLVHCRGGLGRAGTIAARLLVELGMKPATAIASVRAVRPGAIETSDQEKFVLNIGTVRK